MLESRPVLPEVKPMNSNKLMTYSPWRMSVAPMMDW
ncbi:MAG: hypothetical protein ACI90C_001193, partial [Rhodoferax sp.]